MKKKTFAKKSLALGLTTALAFGSVAFGNLPGASLVSKAASEVDFAENFDDYEDNSSLKGHQFGGPTFTLVDDGVDGSKALLVSNRSQNYFGYAINVKQYRGNTIRVSFDAAIPGQEGEDSQTVNASIKLSSSSGDDYKQAASGTVTGSGFTTITNEYEVPADIDNAEIYFESDADVSYIIDNISFEVVGDYVEPSLNIDYVDFSEYPVLKDLYKDYFKLGISCEAISRPNGDNPELREIGNETKEAFMAQEFNTITFANELKPENNMKWDSENATDTYLPFELCSSAQEMLDWVSDNGIQIRAHVLVWHSQCPDEAFCKDYTPVMKNGRLDPDCLVDRETMLARMESYIDSAMKEIYSKGYADDIYAWDVVNEAFEPSNGKPGLMRDSYWYQTIGSDFIYYAFKDARDAVAKYSKEYAELYDLDPDGDLSSIQPKLFYNDYNEFQENKRDAIISYFTSTELTGGHNMVEEGLIDGMGMQAHLADNTNIEQFVTALRMYDETFGEVHITELDISQTTTGVNAEHTQAVFYKNYFDALVNEVKNGVNLTSVTIWGLTDDNSWKKETKPLIFNRDLSTKLAFDAMVGVITGDELPEAVFIKPDLSDAYYDFEDGQQPGAVGVRGGGKVSVQSDVTYAGDYAVQSTGRTANWNGISLDVTRFAGQTIEISAMVKSEDEQIKLSADIDGVWPNIATVDSTGEWTKVEGTYSIPKTLTSLNLYFETSDLAEIYVDNLSIKLVGLDEGFEESVNVAKPRGVGHMPALAVTDEEVRSGEKALKVTRSEKDATVSLDISKYVGMEVEVSAYVKTTDDKITLGVDLGECTELSTVDAGDDWTLVTGKIAISDELKSAKAYIETSGNAVMYIDDFTVRPVKEDPKAGWIEEDGIWFYYVDGEKATGWIDDAGKWYYLDDNGKMATGWLNDAGKWYYLKASGAMATGWLKVSDKWYYMSASGAMTTGWQKVDEKWYYFATSGAMATGWQKVNDKWYYFATSGVMATGWQCLNDKWYYLGTSGAMVTGWTLINNKWYFFDTNGVMQSSKWISGVYYVKSSGVMATNEWVDGGKYYVDANGRYVPGKKK